MMDFMLIEDHPWATVAVIGGGGVLLYLYWRGGSSGGGGTVQAGGGYAAPDPTLTAASLQMGAQQAQINGQIAGLNIQGQTQVQLAQIGAGVQNRSVDATQDVTNTQTLAALQAAMATTQAQLSLGIGSQQSTVDLARIQAEVQMAEINALVRAYGGTPAGGSPGPWTNPITQITPTYTPPPNNYLPPQTVPGPGGGIGGNLVPRPGFASCDPRDSACVARNQDLDVTWVNNVLVGQATSNKQQCLANAALSQGQPNYAALVAACG